MKAVELRDLDVDGLNAKAQERAVANYKKNKGIAMDTPKATPVAAKPAAKKK